MKRALILWASLSVAAPLVVGCADGRNQWNGPRDGRGAYSDQSEAPTYVLVREDGQGNLTYTILNEALTEQRLSETLNRGNVNWQGMDQNRLIDDGYGEANDAGMYFMREASDFDANFEEEAPMVTRSYHRYGRQRYHRNRGGCGSYRHGYHRYRNYCGGSDYEYSHHYPRRNDYPRQDFYYNNWYYQPTYYYQYSWYYYVPYYTNPYWYAGYTYYYYARWW